jgi:class 3 adenylate cyclase
MAVRLGLGEGSPEPSARGGVPAGRGDREPVDRHGAVVQRTFLFTDVVGSTALIEAIGDAAWADLRAWHDAALRRSFEEHGGTEVDHAGDGFFVVFATPSPAIACASAIQRTLAAHRRTAGFSPAVRIAVHAGEATRSGSGYTGRDVHLAARLLDRAGAGDVVATMATLRSAGISPTGPVEAVELVGIGDPVEVALLGWA